MGSYLTSWNAKNNQGKVSDLLFLYVTDVIQTDCIEYEQQ